MAKIIKINTGFKVPILLTDKKSSVQKTSGTSPLKMTDIEQITSHALAAEYLGKKILFLDNIVGEDLLNVIKYSEKVIAFHGMMTNLGYILNKPVLDLFHCKINSWNDYQRYRNSFYEFKPKYNNYDFIIPKKDINKTINKLKFSLKKCQIN